MVLCIWILEQRGESQHAFREKWVVGKRAETTDLIAFTQSVISEALSETPQKEGRESSAGL